MAGDAGPCRIVVAPDGFGGTLTASEAAEAISTGWSRVRDDELSVVPLSDGGPGLIDVLSRATGGQLSTVRTHSPLGVPVEAQILTVADTSYVESAMACGLHLVPTVARDPSRTSTWGVGELIRAALDAGSRRIVVGLGGSATNDGGCGMLAALGAEVTPGGLVGGGALSAARKVDLRGLDPRLRHVTVVAATDVDNRLLGPDGASAVFGPQKGANPRDVHRLDGALRAWSQAFPHGEELRNRPGAGAAGGLGFALFALGAKRRSGIELILEATRLTARLSTADLVITGEGCFDRQSLHGKVVSGVAGAASSAGVPCLVLAGQVEIGPDEFTQAGVSVAYAVAEKAGSVARALAAPREQLSDLAAHVASRVASSYRSAPPSSSNSRTP